VLWDELIRAGGLASVFIGLVVGAPSLLKFASQALQDKIFPEILSGEKRICLAVTEPDAGSDVRNIKTTAEKHQTGNTTSSTALRNGSQTACSATTS
jgi:alkylation response protein AidB-like acyl-CoA dehydrogenase